MDLQIALTIPGWMYVSDLALLSIVSKHTPANTSFVEFGNFLGRSTRAVSDNVSPSVKIHAVDVWDINAPFPNPRTIHSDLVRKWQVTNGAPKESTICQNFEHACKIASDSGTWETPFSLFTKNTNYFDGTSNIVNYCGTTADFAVPSNTAVAFIDADHSLEGVWSDIQKFNQTPEVLVCGHDFESSHHNGVVQALVQYMQSQSGNNMDTNRTLMVLPNTSIWFLIPPSGYWATAFYNKVMPEYQLVSPGLLKTPRYKD